MLLAVAVCSLLRCSLCNCKSIAPFVVPQRRTPFAFIAFAGWFVHHAACLAPRPRTRRALRSRRPPRAGFACLRPHVNSNVSSQCTFVAHWL